ncbi:Cytochrome O ubiquinol oxidase protein cyoD [Granulibacter bethesdensis]|uniref:cytochrome o ubiquinol oxidase subunit IV n=1 Tax=Granulibacter bethesdensis TaxID=364410 RepID=UPI0009097FFC|nr:cytochrome o ubiquinol oxidase subunit IV [Granulibacter bethesdensis]APH57085.1 Cytochrome O ubiquinol oxidase protein cyoD [Granulibacter bethesdensis]
MATAHAHGASDHGSSHGSVGSYITGFILSVILTAAAFLIVAYKLIPEHLILPGVAALAVIQILVHLVFFLHMNASSEQRWNVTAFVFSVVVLLILVSGSIWIMYNLTSRMDHGPATPSLVTQPAAH